MKKSCKSCGYMMKSEACEKCAGKMTKAQKKAKTPPEVNKSALEKGKIAEMRADMAASQGVAAPKAGVIPNVRQDHVTGQKTPKATASFTKTKLAKDGDMEAGALDKAAPQAVASAAPRAGAPGQAIGKPKTAAAAGVTAMKPKANTSTGPALVKGQSYKKLKEAEEMKKAKRSQERKEIGVNNPHVSGGTSQAGHNIRLAAKQQHPGMKSHFNEKAKFIHELNIDNAKKMPKPSLTKGMSLRQLKKAEQLQAKEEQVQTLASKAQEALKAIKPETK